MLYIRYIIKALKGAKASVNRDWMTQNAERVAYRLKKRRGIEMDRPIYSGQSKGPHQNNLCEGCKDGHCSQL
jgi:hypothetical protein